MTRYLSLEEVLVLHEIILRETSGAPGIRDLGLLHAAIERPKATFGGAELYPTLAVKAAALLHSLVLNHPFVDANKRSATVAMIEFLGLNRRRVTFSPETLYAFVMWVAEKKPSVPEIAKRLTRHQRRKRSRG